MGTIDFRYPFVSTTKTNMKLFLIAAVLIASVFAEPESEAKADAWYGAYGYGGYPYAGAYGAYAGAYGLGYNGYAAGYRYLGKRSADSDAEAKPWLTYGAGYGYAGYPCRHLWCLCCPSCHLRSCCLCCPSRHLCRSSPHRQEIC